MNKSLLITRPNHDLTTSYLFSWSGEIIKEAKDRKIPCFDLKGKKANKKEFTRVIGKIKPLLVVVNGHGNDESVTGFNNEILVTVGENEKLLEGKITYAVSCRSAKILGPKCVALGAITYFGYTEDFIFMLEEVKASKPLEDETASLFLKPSNEIPLSLLKGQPTAQAYRNSRQMFRKNIQSLLTSEASSQDKEALPYLLWDLRHQVCLGDKKASLS